MFPNIILQSSSSNCDGKRPFSVPCVPTGMKTGVSTTLCGSVIAHALAFDVEHSPKILSDKACLHVLAVAMLLSGIPGAIPNMTNQIRRNEIV